MPKNYTKQSDFDAAFEALLVRRQIEISEATNAWIRAITGLKRLEDDEARDRDVYLAAMEVLTERYGFQVCHPGYLRPENPENEEPDKEAPCYTALGEEICKSCELRDKYEQFLEEEAKKKIPPPAFDLKLENDIWPVDGEIRWFYLKHKMASTAETPVSGRRPLCFASEQGAKAFYRFTKRYPDLVKKYRIELEDTVLTSAPTKSLVTVRYLAKVLHDPAEKKTGEGL